MVLSPPSCVGKRGSSSRHNHVYHIAVGLVLLFVGMTIAQAQADSAKLPAGEKHVYLLMGQSNMAGRGKIEEKDKTPHPRVFALSTNNIWEPAIEPITKDRPTNLGVGPGLEFGKIMAERSTNAVILLVPCAVGGTPLKRWERGGDLYERAVARARIAVRDGQFKGVLWHQGEQDSNDEANANSYGERLARMIGDLREALNVPKLPFVAGQIGEFLYTRKEKGKSPFARVVNDAICSIQERVQFATCVKSTGLNHSGDEVHFDTAAQHEFAKRYAAEIIRLQDSALRISPANVP
jgi:hypothetical protein